MSVETTRTAPPAYETSSLFNAHAPVPPHYRDTALALESPQSSLLASSSSHNEGLRVSSSQRIEEVTTPPAQPELARHESGMAPHRSIRKLIQRALSPSYLSHPSQSLTQRAQSPATVPTPPQIAFVSSTDTLSRPRSRTLSFRPPTHTEGSSSTSRTRTRLPRLLTHGREMAQSAESLRRVESESSLQSSSASPKVKRTNSVQASPSASRHQALTPTVQQVLSNTSKPLKYVA